MIREYALEEHDKETGKPIGKFTVTKSKTKEAAMEVLATHLKIVEKKEAEEYLAKYFDAVWNHMDVNETGKLEAVELNKFMRTLCKPKAENINLE